MINSGVYLVRVNERIMYVKMVIGKQVVNIVSAYAPQVVLGSEEKDIFWDRFIIELSGMPMQHNIHNAINHVGRDADGCAVRGGMRTRTAE